MINLWEHQVEFIERSRAKLRGGCKALLMQASTGFGKCLGVDTPILMYDGSIKLVQDVKRDDLLMGPDSQPRKVTSICRGKERLYKIQPIKGDSWVCNESHILSLRRTNATQSTGAKGYETRSKLKGHLVNISVRDYLQKTNSFKHIYKMWRTGVDFNNSTQLKIDPYFLGVWLGDGHSNHPAITTMDNEIVQEVYSQAQKYGLGITVQTYKVANKAKTYHLVRTKNDMRKPNQLMKLLKADNLICNKHIPHKYKTASREARLQLLAGLIDTDGSLDKNTFSITSKSRLLADDICFLARSLGFYSKVKPIHKTCTNTGVRGKYYYINVIGDCSVIPTRLERKRAYKRAIKKNPLYTGFDIIPMGHGDYYGFEISGNDRLFLLGDFTVTHNTICSTFMINGVVTRGKSAAFVVPRQELAFQTSAALNEFNIPHSFVANNRPFYNRHQVHICTTGSLTNRLHWINPDLIILDEIHYAGSQMDKIVKHYKGLGKTIIGLSATPSRLDGRGLGCWFDDMIEGPTTRWLMDHKYLSEYEYFRADAPDLSGIKKSMGEYAKGQLSEKMENDKVLMGNAATTYKQHAMGKLNVGFCVSRKHAELAAEEFRKQGIPCVAVDGTMDVAKRREIFKAFAKRELLAVMSVELLTFGFDLELAAGMPVTVESMSDLAPTLSVAKQLQKMGRVLRRKPDPAFIFDHANNYTRHGLPDDDREWTLLDKPKKAKADKIKAEVVRMDFRLCPKCGASNDLSAYKCKDCGADLPRMERTIEEVEAELKKITAQDKEAMRKQFKQEQASARDLDALIELGKRRGYKNPYGWGINIMKARQRKRG